MQFPEDQNSSLHYACIQGNFMTLKVLLDHCTNCLADPQEFLYLLNKNGKTALDLANELHAKNPDSQAYKQIYQELGVLYSAKEKEIEDVVQTLLKKDL